MTLAVVVALATPIVLRDGHDVTAVDDVGGAPWRAELPSAVQLTCASTGIDVPVASIRPQADGMHIEVFNDLAGPSEVWVRSESDSGDMLWDSGPLPVERGRTELVQPVPPGELSIGCRIGGHEQQRQVELVDVHHAYKAPELTCDEDDEAITMPELPVPANDDGEMPTSYRVATRAALRPLTNWNDAEVEVTASGGYERQRFGSWQYQPMTEVVEHDEVVALVSLGGNDEDAPAAAPWTRAPQVDVCKSFLNPAGLALAS
jgi:hypothetical protein